MISPQAQEWLRQRRQAPAFGATGFSLAALRACMAMPRRPTASDVRCCGGLVGGIPGEWVMAPGAAGDRRLLYLHGGGYVSGTPAFYGNLAAQLSAAARCAVFLPDYRLAPEYPFPAGLEDCIHAHEGLLTTGPDGPAPSQVTFIAGDSAGGGLTLATLLALRDRKRPLPAGAIAISPSADLTLLGESIRSEGELDPIMHPNCLPEFFKMYLAGTDSRHPLASPAFGDYTDLPPLLIHVGEHEILRSDSVMVASRAKAGGVHVALTIWPGLFHVFHQEDLPESREAIEQIATFVWSCSTRC